MRGVDIVTRHAPRGTAMPSPGWRPSPRCVGN
jgi:hypothetical protein